MTRKANVVANHVTDDTCLDLVQGLLDVPARRAALDHMHVCAPCEAQFREAAASHARALAAASALTQAAPSATIRWFARPATAIALAASIVGVVGLSWFLNRPGPEPAAFEGVTVRLPTAELRGATRNFRPTTIDSMVLAGIDAYERGDYPGAKRLLTQGQANGRFEDLRRIYLGCTLLELDEPEAARSALAGVDTKMVPEPWRSESVWAFAIASARSGHAATADSILQHLVREGGPLADRARAQLNPAGGDR